MANFVLYLLESSTILVGLYSIYILLLSRGTFFNFNRFFLLSILLLSLIIPMINFGLVPNNIGQVSKTIDEFNQIRMVYYEGLVGKNLSENLANSEKISTLVLLLLSLYGIIALHLVFRFGKTCKHILDIKNSGNVLNKDGIRIVSTSIETAPFSFLRYSFINEKSLEPKEFDQIVAHEKIHIKEGHSYDLIFVQLLAAVFWFNPIIWHVIKSLKSTHEYIADKKIIQQGYSLVEYQALLLRQLISNNSFGLVHNFNLSFIKKRITMMKTKEAGWTGKVKMTIATCALIVVSLISAQSNSLIQSQLKFLDKNSNITFYFGGERLNLSGKGVTYSAIRTGKSQYEISKDASKRLRKSGGTIEFTLIRKSRAIAAFKEDHIQLKNTLKAETLLKQAEVGDSIVIEIKDNGADLFHRYTTFSIIED